ncbi:hypothetical protein LTR36_000983 [Oleoguttula mirabilis]|uniref:Carboxymethylenebutenolidase n=1 Tax=Oleoguttula mirabilis TaxID=1507867 RepID=A0AAV9JPK6_9PEZI|nr:hypothetical protein LTR36_000983 [Oleoguttula mirabilis]
MNGSPDVKETPVALPSARAFAVSDTITIQPPLTRRGHGPALIILVPAHLDLGSSAKTLDPPPLQKWAEEGYTVVQLKVSDDVSSLKDDIQRALKACSDLTECDTTDSVGLISYGVQVSDGLSIAINERAEIAAVITHGEEGVQTQKPQLRHISKALLVATSKDVVAKATFYYPNTGNYFAIPAHSDFRSASAAVAHTRCLTFLKPIVGGPYFDLEAIWEEHTRFEFAERAVEKTMGTMVQEPYVNHVPTMTGGIGREKLTNFYRHHFIFNNPADTNLELVSRTVGIDRVIDEFIFSFTHDRMIDWLLPGVPPTGIYVEIPFTSIVNIRGDRLFHEHISWDQATVLRQLGLLPEYLPFPYAVSGPEGMQPSPGKRLEYRVPTAGIETAKKLVDESEVVSNGMFAYAIREVDNI